MSLTDEILVMIQHEIQQLPSPLLATIKKINPNSTINVETDNGTLNYVKTLGGEPVVNNNCLIIFLNQSHDEYIAIC